VGSSSLRYGDGEGGGIVAVGSDVELGVGIVVLSGVGVLGIGSDVEKVLRSPRSFGDACH
jgi:hypothetical protein